MTKRFKFHQNGNLILWQPVTKSSLMNFNPLQPSDPVLLPQNTCSSLLLCIRWHLAVYMEIKNEITFDNPAGRTLALLSEQWFGTVRVSSEELVDIEINWIKIILFISYFWSQDPYLLLAVLENVSCSDPGFRPSN